MIKFLSRLLLAITFFTSPVYADVIFSANPVIIKGTKNADEIFSYSKENVVIIGCGGNDNLSGGLNNTIQRLYANGGPNGECASQTPGTEDVANIGRNDIATHFKWYVVHGFNYAGEYARIDNFRVGISKLAFPVPIRPRVVMSNTTTLNWRTVEGGHRVDVTGVYFEVPGVTTTREEGVGTIVLVKINDIINVFVPTGQTALEQPAIQALKSKILVSG